MASVATLRELLEPTTLPADLVGEMLSDTNTLWLLGAPDELVAGELVLCHPPLGAGEVRAVVNQTELPFRWRVTVVTRDRPGLLANTSATLAGAGLSVVDFAATVLPTSRLALQRVTVATAPRAWVQDDQWAKLGRDLRTNLAEGRSPRGQFVPKGPVVIEAQPQELGRTVVTVTAPDRLGLLHATANWFETQECNLESCRGGTEGDRAKDVFIVAGAVDTAALASALGGVAPGSIVTRVATTPLHVAVGVASTAIHEVVAVSEVVSRSANEASRVFSDVLRAVAGRNRR